MSKASYILGITLCAWCVIAFAAPDRLWRNPHSWAPLGNHLVQAAPAVDPDQAAALARDATGGEVLGVRTVRRGGKTLYQVKVLLPGGRVRVVPIDAQSGRLLGR
jgi:uncharacterized iron-regulated membrane protein